MQITGLPQTGNFTGTDVLAIEINGVTYKLDGATLAMAIASIGSLVTGVKGNNEGTYRTGNVNITPANIGALAPSDVVNNLISTSTTAPLSAAQGKELADRVTPVSKGGTGGTTVDEAKVNFQLGVTDQNFTVNSGGGESHWAMQFNGNVKNANCDWNGRRITLVIHETRGVYIYDITNNTRLFSFYNTKTVTGTTSANGNLNLNLDPNYVVIYQVYSATNDRIVTVATSGNSSGPNTIFAHVTNLSGTVAANESIKLIVVYGHIPTGIINFS